MSENNEDTKEYFVKIMKDFLTDIIGTFPEYKEELTEEEIHILVTDLSDVNMENASVLYEYCCKMYPQHFFNILYQNDTIFKDASNNSYFLPNINFTEIWKQNISDNTRTIIWKYLQLVLFTVSRQLDSDKSFGDAAKLFEAIDEDELSKKLEESMKEMAEMFDASSNIFEDISGGNFTNEDLPNPDDIKNHLTGILDGKLGRLANEIAEETTSELNLNENSNVNDVFENLFKNPTKLMGMVKKVGTKLDEKIKSGEIKQNELMKEASEILNKMKNIPGMKNMDKVFKQMGLNMNNQKVNVNAMKSALNQNMKKSSQRERMLRKLEKRRLEKEQHMQKQEIQKQDMQKQDEDYKYSVYKPNEESKLEKTKTKNKKRRKKKRKNKNKNKK
tara:strand:+ start:457 stop:1623 length:1167 start_codon:yes stop_codon:yes gene_type:complete